MFHTIHGATVVCARLQPQQPAYPPPKQEDDEVPPTVMEHDDEVLAISDEDNVSTWSTV